MQQLKGFASRLLKHRFKLALLLLALFLLLSGAYYGWSRWRGGTKASYLTVTVARGNVTDAVQATGVVEPVRVARLSFKSSGTIRKIHVKPGDKVNAGQVLAELDDAELVAQLNQAENNLAQARAKWQALVNGPTPEEIAQAEANVKTARADYESARQSLSRQQELFSAGAIPAADLEKAQADFTKAEAALERAEQALKALKKGNRPEDIEAAKAQVEAAKAQVDVARANLEGAKLIAPFTGIVSQVKGEVGEKGSTASGDSAFITLISEEMQVRLSVNEADIGKVKPDQEVSFSVAAYPERTFSGRVTSVYPQGSTVSNVQVFDVLVSFADPDHLLRPGMLATANIVVAKKEGVLTVPQMALNFASSYMRENRAGARRQDSQGSLRGGAPPAGEERQLVLVLEGDKPVPRRVKTGLSDGQYVEVVEGLNEGEKVVIGATSGRQAASQGGTGGTRATQQRQAPLPGMPGAPQGGRQLR